MTLALSVVDYSTVFVSPQPEVEVAHELVEIVVRSAGVQKNLGDRVYIRGRPSLQNESRNTTR